MTDASLPSAAASSETLRLRRLFQLFGATQARGRSAVYEALSGEIAGDEELLGLLHGTPPDQQRPSLLFAAVNRLLAQDRGAELCAYYPIHGGARWPDGRLAPAFRDFCSAHDAALAKLLRERSTQTNEIRRCVALRLALGEVQRHWPGPMALVEVGASAGLNLLFDHYRYRVGRHESGPASPVLVASELRGAVQIEMPDPPPITRRLGIDQSPIDLRDPEARAWLEAFVWPEQMHDLAALRGAIDLALAAPGVAVRAGEATSDTARLIDEQPGDEPVVVFTASLLSYLTADARVAFVAQLDAVARRRPVAWAFAEGPALLASARLRIPALAGSLGRNNAQYAVGVSLRGPARQDRLLALADAYVRWLAPARGDADDFQWVTES
jgi:hypothetical protein